MDVEAIFATKKKRVIKRRKFFGEEPEIVDETMNLSPEESFRISYFIQVMDQALYILLRQDLSNLKSMNKHLVSYLIWRN